uniref:Peptidase A1 domain-containing protein n=1 Tax=Oryza glumipatula TaxID=40148 RepID=A0A0E0ANN3_9ORYZ
MVGPDGSVAGVREYCNTVLVVTKLGGCAAALGAVPRRGLRQRRHLGAVPLVATRRPTHSSTRPPCLPSPACRVAPRICQILPGTGCGDVGKCDYSVMYGDGSYTKGVLVLEMLTLGGTAVQGIAIGCGHRNSGLFVGAVGLLGLG